MSAYRMQPPFARKAVAAITPAAPGFEPVRAVSRRDFLKAGSVLVVGVSLFGCSQGEAPAGPAESAAGPAPRQKPRRTCSAKRTVTGGWQARRCARTYFCGTG